MGVPLSREVYRDDGRAPDNFLCLGLPYLRPRNSDFQFEQLFWIVRLESRDGIGIVLGYHCPTQLIGTTKIKGVGDPPTKSVAKGLKSDTT